MAVTHLTVEPTSYIFTDVNATTTINLETDASSVKFIKVGKYGDGLVTYNHLTKTLTATRYGRAVYEFQAEAADKEPNSIRYVVEVSRQIVSDKEIDLYVPLKGNKEFEYTPPTGYYYKHVEILADDTCPIEVNEVGMITTFTGNEIGSARCRIILGKEPLDIEEDEDFLEDDEIEYIGGYINVNVFVLNIKPNTSDLSLLKNKTYSFNLISIASADLTTTVPIQFDTEFSSNTPAFSINATLLPSSTGSNEYMLDITSLAEGEGRILFNVYGEILHTIDIFVEDKKEINITPDIEEITLGYDKSFQLINVSYVDNDELRDIDIVVPDDAPFSVVKTLSNDDIPNVYNITITNTSSEGGEGSFIIKGDNTEVNQKTIKVICHKEILPGDIEVNPADQTIRVVQSSAYEFKYVLATNADFITVESSDNNIAVPVLEPLRNIITEVDEDGNTVIKEWPENSIVKKLYVSGQEVGITYITIKSYVNEDDLVAEKRIKVEVNEVDTLPDQSSIVNIRVNSFPKGRKKDILIKFPDHSATLVFKESLSKDLNIEFGYSYDYMSKTNPDVNTNPVPKSTTTGKATWLNLITNEVFTCLDNTKNNNIWRGSNGTWINKNVYPEPGHFNFGKGVASNELIKKYKLTKLENTENMEHEDYGIYVGDNDTRYVFIPKHHIIPIKDITLINTYPYYGIRYEFSYNQDTNFTRETIPRCFINNGKVQEGIFVSITDGTVESDSNKANSAKNSSTSLPSIYKSKGNTTFKYLNYKEYLYNDNYPELREMQLAMKMTETAIPSIGRHNMTIFIQNMLANLADLQIIATYEKNLNNKHTILRLSTPNTASWATTNHTYNPITKTGSPLSEQLVKEKRNGVNGPYSLSISNDYKESYSLSGYKGSIYHINGPINTPLMGILVKVNTEDPDKYEIYSLKETVDVAEMEQEALSTIGTSNVDNLIFRSGIFDTNNYDLICTLDNDAFKNMLYLNKDDPMYTHNENNVSLLKIPDQSGRVGLNIGIDLINLKMNDLSRYSDIPINKNKWRNNSFYLGHVSNNTDLQIEDKVWYGFFVCNYCLSNSEYVHSGVHNTEVRTNGTRNRILYLLGSRQYTKLDSSIYPLTHRTCITPNM